MATWPASNKASTANLDSGSDSPRLARADIKDNVDNVNSIIDMFNIDSPSSNQILKYNSSNARFELGTDNDTAQGSITFVGDDSSGTAVNINETFKIAGGTNITTAVSGDTLTITGAASSNAVTALNNATANELVTVGSTTTELDAESNLTFDGSTLAVTGAMTASTTIGATTNITAGGSITAGTTIGNDAISLTDNKIKPIRSNDTLLVDSGSSNLLETGMTGTFSNYSTNPRWDNGVRRVFDEQSFDFNSQTSSSARKYLHTTLTNVKAQTDSDSSQHNMRWRNGYSILQVDTNGSILANPSPTYFAGAVNELDVTNSAGSSNAGKLAGGVANYANIYLYGNQSQLDMDFARVYQARLFSEAESGQTINLANVVSYYAQGVDHDGSGTHNTTNETAFYYQAGAGTNKFLIDTDTDTAESNVGTLFKYREKISALTSSSSIAVDCSSAPIFTVTLATNTNFTFNNLGTGQSVSVVIKQDGSGNQTASFSGSDSSAVKFSGGTPTLSTAANSIDVVTVLNTGSELIGNIAKAYAA